MKRINWPFILVVLVTVMFWVCVFRCFALPINQKYSHKDFTNKDLRGENPDDFSNSVIMGSCFYQEATADTPYNKLMKDVFPAGIHDVTFSACNLDNVKVVPTGQLTVLPNCTNSAIKVIIDGEENADWIIDKNTGNPKYKVKDKTTPQEVE